MKKYLTEGIGAFYILLVMILVCHNDDLAGAAPFAIGATLAAMTYAGGRVSGAQYNPAITIAMLMREKTDRTDAIYYIVAQCVGAVLAALIGGFLLNCSAGAEVRMHFNKMGMCSLMAEFIGAFALTYVYLNVFTAQEEKGHRGVAMGFMLTGLVYALRSVSGGIFNPALALGLTIVGALDFQDGWIYLVGTLLGAAAAGTVFSLIHNNEAGGQN